MPFVKGDSRINRSGRKKGSKNMTTIPKVEEVMEAIQKQGIKSIQKLVTLANDDRTSANVKFKINTWLAEMYFTIEDMKKASEKNIQEESKETKKSAPIFSLKAV